VSWLDLGEFEESLAKLFAVEDPVGLSAHGLDPLFGLEAGCSSIHIFKVLFLSEIFDLLFHAVTFSGGVDFANLTLALEEFETCESTEFLDDRCDVFVSR